MSTDDSVTYPPIVLDGTARAAVVLSMLDEEIGAEVLKHLDDDEIKTISTAMLELDNLNQKAAVEIADAFFASVQDYEFEVGGWDQVERLLRRALPDTIVDSMMQEVSSRSHVDIWRKLPNIDRGVLLAYLRGEHPQTIAFILSQVGPDFAAAILQKFARKLAVDVISRMLQMQPVHQEALGNVEEVLRVDFLTVQANRRKTDTHVSMAEVFNYFSTESEEVLMAELSQINDASAKKVKSLMFTFKDLVKLDSTAIQTALQAIDKDLLPKALAGATQPVVDLFLTNMSARSAQRLRTDMEAVGTPNQADVDAAQTAILKTTRSLIDKGEIQLASRQLDNA